MAGERVLVVEDNEKNLKLVRDVLQAWVSARSRRQRANRRSSSPLEHDSGLVLMDVQLPGIDGVEALSRLRQTSAQPPIPVLAVTAQAMSGDRERFLAAGFDGYLSKPVDVAELIKAVREHCDRE